MTASLAKESRTKAGLDITTFSCTPGLHLQAGWTRLTWFRKRFRQGGVVDGHARGSGRLRAS
ncbi:MAG TPA: hypothetical protein VJ723_00590, partial [Candidatus Angelobacter sp.]|nr:hypothetical protein [Candidatus Angelobacter sp.]